MNIEKEYILSTDDYINFQQYYLRKNTEKYSPYQWLIVYIPLVYILFSSYYINDYTVKIIGLVISFLLFLYYVLMSLFSNIINKRYIKNKYYKNYISDDIKIKINENSIIEYYKNFEQKIIPQWVDVFEENRDYIYLLNNKNYVIILPKKYFSNDELEIIRENYNKNKFV
jgi:hypothetical protein